MKNIVENYIERLRRERRTRRCFSGVMLALALLVGATVFYQLRYTGIALEGEVYCGLSEHVHSEECYESVLICDAAAAEADAEEADAEDADEEAADEQADKEGHVHTDECRESVLICELSEHEHSQECTIDVSADVEADEDLEEILPQSGGTYAKEDADAADYTQSTEEADDEADAEEVQELYEVIEEELTVQGFSFSSVAAASVMAASDDIASNGSGVSLALSAANSWQIVSERYVGSDAEYKTNTGTDGNVRVQKNVVPTDTENEFLVYLSVDMKELYTDYFATASFKAVSGNSNHDKELGTVISSAPSGSSVDVGTSSSVGSKSATFNIINSSGELLASDIVLYWSKSNNFTIYMEIEDSEGTTYYILIGVSVKENTNNTIMLSDDAEELIKSAASSMVSLTSVSDVVGEYVEFVELVSGDYDSKTSYEQDNRTLTWVPVVKDNLTIDEEKGDESKSVSYTDHSGNSISTTVYSYTSWALNAAELVYRVRLNVSASGFVSCANNMNSTASDSCSYPVSSSATLYYATQSGGSASVHFQQPYVRGLLYDITLKKVDDEGNALEGAEFTLSSAGGTVATATSDSDGLVSFTGLAYGTYSLEETGVPTGYSAIDASKWENIILSYTTTPSLLSAVSDTGHMRYTGNDGDESIWTVVNKMVVTYELPATGGGGKDGYTLTGLMLICMAACLLYKKRKHTKTKNIL